MLGYAIALIDPVPLSRKREKMTVRGTTSHYRSPALIARLSGGRQASFELQTAFGIIG